ncbi:hypothetical protein NA57DRAFT_66545 [Rhizodiscina lignyota]|uniref:G1/S-specific cyclin pas1 n=1 Tax=Rhizodiscina lignyota TaxID=1504668 RepID=A0A9P4IFE2_9PEZI|nr:hypothetical protein NA57DRAFT_66545 [Rhizodiscina lignyota]
MNTTYLLPHPPCETSPRTTHPYQSSLSSSASSSASSIFSVDAPSHSSQSSQSSVSDSIPPSSGDASWRFSDACRVSLEPPTTAKRVLPPPVAVDQRQHPRRCSLSGNRAPPALVRQSERKGQFVDCLVDSATQMVEVIWPTSAPACRKESGRSGILPLRTFIQETLRRSRTSFSTLQVALYYLILIKAHVPHYDFTHPQPEDTPVCRSLQCGRRMFLSALILASKYLQDRNYSARAWSKISGLKVAEINMNEIAFLTAVQWKLHIHESIFEKWQDIILRYTPSSSSPLCGTSIDARWSEWKMLVQRLTPDLEGVAITPRCQSKRASTWPLPPPSPATPTTPITPTPLNSGLSASSESTPTPTAPFHLPSYFEPRLDVRPPTPARLGPLPTPSMTPQSTVSTSGASTPAASMLCAAGPRRPSMCAAMQAAQVNFANRMADQWSCMGSLRRPSLAPSTGSVTMNNSPESMISDASSRSSRASSISSASSVSSAPYGTAQACISTPVKLARLATLRCAGLGPTKEVSHHAEMMDGDDGITIEPMSSPDFESFHIHEVETPAPSIPDDMARLERMDSARSYLSISSTASDDSSMITSSMSSPLKVEVASPSHVKTSSVFADIVNENAHSRNRKRGRSSVDLSLHQNVRNLLVPEVRSLARGCGARSNVQVDDIVASSFVLGKRLELQSPARSVPCLERRLPVQVQRDGRKRACCAKEVVTPREGPGMWEGVL